MSTPCTYEITAHGKAIRCLLCGRTSFNAGDVENHYCGACHRFHDALAMIDLLNIPSALYARHPGLCMRLGTYGTYDLYVGLQAPLPPTLIARYGNAPGAYETFNPHLCGRDNVVRYGVHFVEALRRADEWAVPLGGKIEGEHDERA
jgi:hypothetical protein